MLGTVRITSTFDPVLLGLPWDTQLVDWPADHLVSLPQGISRHVVRFVQMEGMVYAVKETDERIAQREYDLLKSLERIDAPSVEAIAIIADRRDAYGEPLESALVTRHLQFSLPYRALFSNTLRPDTVTRLLDALAALLVRMHLSGFFWGDVSLSNTLFRRDAGAFAAYLVDAETGALHKQLSRGQRAEDIEIARVNIFGEMLDLQAGGVLHESIDPETVADDVVRRYESLWHEVTYEQEVGSTKEVNHQMRTRIRRLNDLGFDVEELSLSSDDGVYRMRPKVVDAGHHTRRLLRLTGLDVEENQARVLLNDLDSYRAEHRLTDEETAAHRWVTDAFEPVVRAVPVELRGKLEPAEVYVQILDHRWYLSENAKRDVGAAFAVASYLVEVLALRPDERAVLGVSVDELAGDDAMMEENLTN
jgi:tRNA A-37 threonylcarbamoyl transferase component Bud32